MWFFCAEQGENRSGLVKNWLNSEIVTNQSDRVIEPSNTGNRNNSSGAEVILVLTKVEFSSEDSKYLEYQSQFCFFSGSVLINIISNVGQWIESTTHFNLEV